MFKQRHFKVVAEELAGFRRELEDLPSLGHSRSMRLAELQDVTERLANLFERTSPKFKRELFMRACGLDEEEQHAKQSHSSSSVASANSNSAG